MALTRKSLFQETVWSLERGKEGDTGRLQSEMVRNTNTLVRSPGSQVYDVAYWIGEGQLKKIEVVEKRGSKWNRIQVKLNIEGNKVNGVTYVLVKQTLSDPPSSEHLNVLLEGLKNHGWGEEGSELLERVSQGFTSRISLLLTAAGRYVTVFTVIGAT
jgi:hypothetical protein